MTRALRLSTDNFLVSWLLVFSVLVFLGGLVMNDGNAGTAVAGLYIFVVIVTSFIRPVLSLYLLIATVLLFDQFGIPGFMPWTYQVAFFKNLKELSYLPYFDQGVMNFIEIHLFFLVAGVLTSLGTKNWVTVRAVPVRIPYLFFFVMMSFSFVYGMRGGGDFLVALWEIRALFYLMMTYLIVPQIIRNKKQLTVLFWIIISGICFKAFQGVLRFVKLGFTTGGIPTLTNHEDPVFITTLMIFLLGLSFFGSRSPQRYLLLLLILPLMLGFHVGLRRAAYAGLIVSTIGFTIIAPAEIRRKLVTYAVPTLLLLTMYGAVFWNSTERGIAAPVQMIRSGLEKPSIETNARDYWSNLYRENENYNLAQTVVNNPVLGVGFGKKYEQPIPLVTIRFPLRDYIPHNEIFWVMVKMGSVGFFAFWFFFNSVAAFGTQVLRQLKDPYLQAVAAMAVISIINQMVVSYFDLQLTYYRNMIYLGCLMGVLSMLKDADSDALAEGQAQEPRWPGASEAKLDSGE